PVPVTLWRRSVLAVTLTLMVLTPIAIGRLIESTVFAQSQTGNSFLGMSMSVDKKFEVATVKASQYDENGPRRLGPPGRGAIQIVNLPLRSIIIQSFRTQRW